MDEPKMTQSKVHLACISGIGDSAQKERCAAIIDLIIEGEARYKQLALARELYSAPSHPRGGDSLPVLLEATRGDLKSLYSKQMVPKTRAARNYYDMIKMSAKGNICPYCGIGSVETLDHFLPKGRYSPYSILPLNLVPSCRDCNTSKSDDATNFESLSSHPYFEDTAVMHDEWLRADIVEQSDIVAVFSAAPPAHWPAERTVRIRNHFNTFDLARRYGIQAATRFTVYAELVADVKDQGGKAMMTSVLSTFAKGEVKACGINSWQAALAKSVLHSEFFLEEGYRRFVRPPKAYRG